MSNRFSTFLKKKLLKKNQNLISVDEPYGVIQRLLRGRDIRAIIDAGASNGHISRRLLASFPDSDVYAFEPNPLYHDALKRYAMENARFHPEFVALSDTEGGGDLYIMESPGNTSLYAPNERLEKIDRIGSNVRSKERVDVVTIDDWAQRHSISSIELMKFDIQGAELCALRGASGMLQRSTLIIYTEVWFNTPYEGGALCSEIDLFMRGHGFVLYDLYKPKYDKVGTIMWANALYASAQKLLV